MKSHFHSSSLSGRPIPEEDVLGSASGSSSSSLDNDHAFAYPPELLGTSWGSYLFSVPATAARSSRKVVINPAPQPLKLPPVSVSSNEQASPKRSILRTPIVRGGTAAPERESKLGADVKDAAEKGECEHRQPHPLLQSLQSLLNAAMTTKEKLSRCGVNPTPLSALCEVLMVAQHEITQTLERTLCTEGGNAGAVGSAVSFNLLQLVFKSLESALQSLVEQGEKLDEKAAFLQQTGKQLNRNQREFWREQNELQQAMEDARTHLAVEKQALEEQRKVLAITENELQKWMKKQELTGKRGPAHHKPTPFVTGGVLGHSRAMSLAQSEKEHTRLEKLLLQQQREIRELQREQRTTKTELFKTQEHAERLQHKLENCITEARRNEEDLSLKLHGAQGKNHQNKGTKRSGMSQQDRVLANVSGVSAAHRVLHQEIERVQRQLKDQQERGQRLQQQVEATCQRLKGTGPKLSDQYGDNAAGQGHSNMRGKHKERRPLHPKPSTLPKITSVHTKKQLPSFSFSRSELITLASFDKSETAEEVLDWLGQHGILN